MENKTSKPASQTGRYFKYAIGEILLVMIGILLALQVNNWNEKRKLLKSIDNLLIAFENELVNNIDESDGLIGRGYYKDSMLTRYNKNKITGEDILSHEGLFLGFGTRTRQFNNDNLDKLIALEKDLPETYLQLIPELKQLKRRIESQRKYEEKIIELSWERNKENIDQLPWVDLKDSLSREKAVNFILTDSIFKNKIRHYHYLDLNENTWDASLIKTSSLALLWTIKKLRRAQDSSIETFLQNFEMKPFQELECNGYPFEKKENVNFRLNYIFYNNTDEAISYNYVDLNGEILNSRERSISPKSFNIREFSLPTNIMIEVKAKDSCKKVYRRNKEDYLVIN